MACCSPGRTLRFEMSRLSPGGVTVISVNAPASFLLPFGRRSVPTGSPEIGLVREVRERARPPLTLVSLTHRPRSATGAAPQYKARTLRASAGEQVWPIPWDIHTGQWISTRG